jgi:hypothetical protein
MKKSLIIAAMLACAGLFSNPQAFAQKHTVEEIKVAQVSEGDKIRGPRTIKAKTVNRLRYKVQLKGSTSFSAGPSLALPFIPPLASAVVPPAPPGGASDTDDEFDNKMTAADGAATTEQKFISLEEGFVLLNRRRVLTIQNPIASHVTITNEASTATENFVRETDSKLGGNNGPQEVLSNIPARITQIDNARVRWPDSLINIFLARVDELDSRLNRISDLTWLVTNKSRVDSLVARVGTLRESVIELSHNGKPDSPAAKFDKAQGVLRQWREIFADAQAQRESYFELPYKDVGCGFAFDQNKETKIILIKQDRLASPDAAAVEQELVTVVCSSPFSVSGGFGFSSVNEREFVFVQSTKPVTANGITTQQVINRFGFKNNSSFRPIPLLLLNTRVYERSDDIALHLSAGAGVDIKTGEAGSDVEFIVGPSVSFKRSLFVTAGFHVGRVPKLAGGFNLGDEVPEGIDAPPVEKAWKTGFIVALTFKLR